MALTPKQERYAEAIASGKNRKEAAEAADIGVRMASEWLRTLPELNARIEELSKKVKADAVSILSANLATAANTMVELLGQDQPPAVRLSAARGIFADYAAIKQFSELESEITDLKAKVGKTKAAL
jgi:hypothetical protein